MSLFFRIFVICLFSTVQHTLAAARNANQYEVLSQLTLLATSQVYSAKLKLYDIPTTWQCIDSTNMHALSIDMPKAYVQVIKHQSNSLVVFVNKLTGDKYYARANVSPVVYMIFSSKALEVRAALIHGFQSRIILHADFSNLITRVSSWREKVVAGDGRTNYSYENDAEKKQVYLNFQSQKTVIEFYRQANLDMRLEVQTEPKFDNEFIVALCSDNNPAIVDFSEKETEKLINSFINIITRGPVVPTENPEQKPGSLRH